MEADAREVPVRILGAGRRRGPRGRPRVEGRAAGGVLFDDWHDPDAMYEHAAATITEEELEEAVIVSANPQEHVERIALLNVSGADPHRDATYRDHVLPRCASNRNRLLHVQPTAMAIAVPHRRIGRVDTTRRGYLRRDVGLVGLLFASLGSIIGSGWLFGALYAAQVAGPAALVSWGLGAAFVLILALVHAELGGAYPVAGGSARFPHYAYGSVIGFGIGWIAWLGAVTTAPIEVEAALQYATHYISWLTTTSGGETVLTTQGYAVAAVLMLVFTVVNILGVRKLARSNNAITVWKVAIPAIAIVALMVTVFHGANFHAGGGFNPYGWHGIFSAISTGGVIFAYLGFEQAIQLGGESCNPRRNIPVAVIGAMIFGVLLYVLLQVAFLGALDPHNLSHGWSKLAFNGLVGPFAGLASTVGLGWLAVLLYVDAAISPGGTGLLYTGTSSRLFYAMSRERFLWSPLSALNSRRVPVVSIFISFCVGMLLFLPFP